MFLLSMKTLRNKSWLKKCMHSLQEKSKYNRNQPFSVFKNHNNFFNQFIIFGTHFEMLFRSFSYSPVSSSMDVSQI